MPKVKKTTAKPSIPVIVDAPMVTIKRLPAAHSKVGILITLLKRTKGTTLEDMVKATGWQKHSIHGAIAGTLRKKLGLNVICEVSEAGRSYRIA